MSTPQWQEQFRRNEELIARCSGYHNLSYNLDMVVPDLHGRTVIADCGHIITQKEYERNGEGYCDACVIKRSYLLGM